MKRHFLNLCFSVLLLAIYSCDKELHIMMPQGPKGSDGVSAYEVWAQAVKDGAINWDADRTDINNYFLYLKGNDGQEGKSAYQLWLDALAAGIENPHSPSEQWSRDKSSVQDFWYFLTGAKGQDGGVPTIGNNGNWFIDGEDTGLPAKGKDGSSVVTIGGNGNWFIDGTDTGTAAFGQNGAPGSNGQNAYELWVAEVAKGIDDPHNPGQQWAKDKTSTSDFWNFLRGKDGENAEENKLEDDRILIGKPNVLLQPVASNYNEFINPEDGSVRYRVYDIAGSPAPGAKVQLPGITKEYTADANGYFIVEKDDLPAAKPATKVAMVTYSGETKESAENAEVPARMLVRIRLQDTNPFPRLDVTNAKTHVAFYLIVERSADGGTTWEPIPAYLGGINARHGIKAYVCSDPNDPQSYIRNGDTYTSSILPTSFNNLIDVTRNDYIVRVNRLRREEWYYPNVADKWDGQNHYFTLVVDGTYYGELLQLNAVTKMPPIQGMPFIKDITAADWDPGTYSVRPVTGDLDISHVDYDLMFKAALKAVNMGTHTYFEPENEEASVYLNAPLRVAFGNEEALPALQSTPFTIKTSLVSKATPTPANWITVTLTTTTHYFYSLNTIGRFRFKDGAELNKNSLIITRTGTNYNYPDIEVTYIE